VLSSQILRGTKFEGESMDLVIEFGSIGGRLGQYAAMLSILMPAVAFVLLIGVRI
jgi:hypothetical protein